MPETLKERPADAETVSRLEATGIRRYFKFLTDQRIVIGIATVFLAQFRNNTIEILLPYTSIRFGLELGQVRTLDPEHIFSL
jgi:hypothetical protein